jgi:hypothetical protein
MSVKREIRDYLNDIAESVEDIRSFTEGLTFDDFVADKKTIEPPPGSDRANHLILPIHQSNRPCLRGLESPF